MVFKKRNINNVVLIREGIENKKKREATKKGKQHAKHGLHKGKKR